MNQMSDQLRDAIEETESRNQALAVRIETQQLFFASVSHEFKTPLGLIRGYGELLQGTAKVPKASRDQATAVIMDEVDHLARLVDDLLTLTRLGMVGFQLNLKRVSLPAMVLRASERFQETLKPKELSLVMKLPSGGEAELDEMRITQALDNILSNAIRHATPQSSIRITLEQLGQEWQLQIVNQGQKLEESDLQKIFQPFYRVDHHRNRSDGGSGLGLAIVSEILRLHGGSVEARNTYHGVSILVRIPPSCVETRKLF